MAKCEVLNNITHYNLKVDTRYTPEFGDDVDNVPIFVNEFSELHKEYPLFLYKNASSDIFFPVAMLGFDDKNLFLEDSSNSVGWNARYIPASKSCGPFLIGFQNQWSGGDLEKSPVIHIDMENPRVNFSDGEDLFLPMGGLSDYLKKVSESLQLVHQGISLNKEFISACVALDLIESVKLEIMIDDVHEYRVSGYYTINKEKLYSLSAESLARFHGAGFLEAAFYMLSSLSNIPVLIDLKNKKISAEIKSQ